MKSEELYEILGGIDEKYIDEAKKQRSSVNIGRILRVALAGVFIVAAMAFVLVPAIKNSGETPILPPDTIDTPIVTDTKETETDETTTTSDTGEPPSMGGDGYCYVHSSEYHSFPGEIIDWIKDNNKDFYEWLNISENQSSSIKSDCPFSCSNIYQLVKYFDIPKEVWINYYNNALIREYLNIDLLYAGTEEENDKYYRLSSRDESALEESKKWNRFFEMKDIILRKSKSEGKSINWSFVQIAQSAGITDLSKVLPAQDFKESSTEFIYNADALSALPEKDIEEIIEKYTPYYLDCLICGLTPYDTPYERQVALNAEKEQEK